MRSLLVTVLLIVFGMVDATEAAVRIATAGPMSGARAWSGEQFRRGAELAVADINAAGGVLGQQLELVVGDDASDAEQAEAVARKLVADGVVMVAGHRASGASIAASAVYAAAGVIQISPSSTNPQFTERGLNNVFRVCGRDDQQGGVAGDYLARHWKTKPIAIVHDDSAYGRGLAEQTQARLREHGIKESFYASYDPEQRDYSDLIAQLRALSIEVLYVGGYSTESGLILRQSHDAGYPIQLVSGDALHNTDFWMITGEVGENALFTFGADPRESVEAADVVKRLRADNYEPDGYTVHTYAAIQIWAQAVKSVGSFDVEKVAAVLHSQQFDTVLGPLSFDLKGDVEKHNFVWYGWRDGSYRRADPL